MKASCDCGALTLFVSAAAKRVAICHCDACRVRTGSAFSWNLRFDVDAVQPEGAANCYTRIGEEGSAITYYFCPTCGVTMWYENDQIAGRMVPAGVLPRADLPAPDVSVYDDRRPAWLQAEVPEVLI